MQRRLLVSAVLTLPVFAAAMADMLPGRPLHALFAPRTLAFAQLALATPVVLWGGWPFFQRGVASLRSRHLNMFTLIALGTGAAWLSSVVATLAPGVFPASFRGHDGGAPVYFEAAAVIVTLVLLGQVLELRARHRTGAAIRSLLALAPRTARRLARRRRRGRRRARRRRSRRSAARAARREGSRRRRGDRGSFGARRVDAHRRADARGEGTRRPRDRRHRQSGGQLRDARRSRGQRDAARADRRAGRRGAALACADPDGSPTRSRRGSCPRWWWSRC